MQTLAAAALPRTAVHGPTTVLRSALLVLGASLFVALSAQISIPMWPVPLTGQTLAVLLTGAVLGSRLGALALLVYLAEGLAGLPVFSAGANAWTATRTPGVPYILGTTAGYLVGFVVAAGIVGWLAERGWDRSVRRAALAMLVGQLVIYALGLIGLLRFLPLEAAFQAGILPFLPGDAIKLALAALALPGAWRLLGHPRP